MKTSDRKISYTPLTQNLKKKYALVDNELESSIRQLALFAKGHLYGLTKKKGITLPQVMFTILIWPLLSIGSLNFFCGNRLQAYFNGKKDVLYDFLKRQNINWRGYRFHVAKQFYKRHSLKHEKILACVFDDTIKRRRGKQVSAVSSHYDHNDSKYVMGQQVLDMGLATSKAYLPLDSQIYVGEKNVQEGKYEFDDARNTLAKDYDVAMNKNKNEMLRIMLMRAIRSGIRFTHVIADSWFGNRDNIKAIIAAKLTGVIRMKRGNLRYIFNDNRYTLTELYALIQRRMTPMKGTKYKAYALNVFLPVPEKDNEELIPVKLLFSAPVSINKDNWGVFLSTDICLSPEEILSIYSLRWGIEVYFKEVKQHFGFLKEQTGDYAVHYASIHLAAIRFIIIMDISLRTGDAFGVIRNQITKRLETITFARLLWELFKALIYGALDGLRDLISVKTIKLIKKAINLRVSDFLATALQLDEDYLQNELKAEACGAL